MIAALLSISNRINTESTSIDEALITFEIISEIPVSCQVALTITLALLRAFNRLPWNILVSSLVAHVLAFIVTFYPESINDFVPDGAVCGTSKPISLCDYSPSVSRPWNRLLVGSATSTVVIGLITADLVSGSQGQPTPTPVPRADKTPTRRHGTSIAYSKHRFNIWSAVGYSILLVAYIVTCTAYALQYYYMYMIAYRPTKASKGNDTGEWTFGQIVAVLVWTDTLYVFVVGEIRLIRAQHFGKISGKHDTITSEHQNAGTRHTQFSRFLQEPFTTTLRAFRRHDHAVDDRSPSDA